MTEHDPHSEVLDQTRLERTKADFSLDLAKKARELSWLAVAEIKKLIRPGMTEEEALKAGQAKLAEMGVSKNWHRLYVRFGVNTLLHYGMPSEPGVTLAENDIYYLDLGPVWGTQPNEYEGDAGDTFVVGSNPEHHRCARDCREIFNLVARAWKEKKLGGKALYELAQNETVKRGWTLNLEVNGHRLSDFPHALYFKGSLTDAEFAPTPALWVLEIQIRHPTEKFGAFFEDWLI